MPTARRPRTSRTHARSPASWRIPLHRVSFAREYRERVFEHFLAEHAAGRTPNPDVLCNREIKFGVCLAWAQRLGGTHFATGHYARLRAEADGPAALQGARCRQGPELFPARGGPRGPVAGAHAARGAAQGARCASWRAQAGLPVFDKPDSTGICFIGERPFREFLGRFLKRTPGPIESADGEQLGSHEGLAFYTLGQRTGPAHRWPPRARRAAVVRRRQGRRPQRAHRGAGPRPPAADAAPQSFQRPLALAGAGPRGALQRPGQSALPAGGPAGAAGAGRRPDRSALFSNIRSAR